MLKCQLLEKRLRLLAETKQRLPPPPIFPICSTLHQGPKILDAALKTIKNRFKLLFKRSLATTSYTGEVTENKTYNSIRAIIMSKTSGLQF